MSWLCNEVFLHVVGDDIFSYCRPAFQGAEPRVVDLGEVVTATNEATVSRQRSYQLDSDMGSPEAAKWIPGLLQSRKHLDSHYSQHP